MTPTQNDGLRASNDIAVRVRFAPSPTGNLHIGGARTALFNYLFAKHAGGKFILRIEDTDIERSKREFEKNIFDSLDWLGLQADEDPRIGGSFGPYRQSERLDIYKRYIQRLLDQDAAYYCFCSKEELEVEHTAMEQAGLPPKYSGKCRARNAKTGEGVIRFKTPTEKITFYDLIRGEITFDGSLMGDIVIAKNSHAPLYNLGAVIDDYEMKISHVVRGEEHLGNTPKQIFLQKALNLPAPIYAHTPLILDQQKAKLSKRAGATSVSDFKNDGFLPEALINFMALLGWHPRQGDKEILTLQELMAEFSLERVQKAGAIFNLEKLQWLNGEHIKKMIPEKLLARILDFTSAVVKEKILSLTAARQLALTTLCQDRLKTLKDFEAVSFLFFEIGEYPAELLIWKASPRELIKHSLNEALATLRKLTDDDFRKEKLELTIAPVAQKFGRGETFWPLRVALSGSQNSPGPLEIMAVLGKDESIKRIEAAIAEIAS